MKKITWLLFLSCSLLFQSCFEMVEQVFLKSDGSGNLQLILNMSKSKTKLNSIIKMKTVNGHDVPSKEDISKKIKEIEKTIAQTRGISNVKTSMDFDNYIATLSCSFTNITQLNTVIKNISDHEKAGTKINEQFYAYDAAKKVFVRKNTFSLKDAYQKMSNADKEIFATANYTSIFKFETGVEANSNKEAKVSPNKKAVMLKLNALDIITNKKTIENSINLTK